MKFRASHSEELCDLQRLFDGAGGHVNMMVEAKNPLNIFGDEICSKMSAWKTEKM
jgi:hypothetical protein